MAVPFYIPEEEETSSGSNSEASSAANTVPNSPTRPIPIPQQNSNSPQYSPIDNETLVQAFYEALCRCSQDMPGFSISSTPTPSSAPTSPFSRGHFFFPPATPQHFYSSSPSTSAVSSPRNSFRGVPRRRLNSYGSQSQYSQFSEENIEEYDESNLVQWERHYQQREQLEEFSGRVPQPKTKFNNQKPDKKPKEENKSKITSFVISALQFVIDSLR